MFVYSELPTRLTYLYFRCVLKVTLILFKDFVLTSFPSLRIPRCHVGMDDTAYTLSSSSFIRSNYLHKPLLRCQNVVLLYNTDAAIKARLFGQ